MPRSKEYFGPEEITYQETSFLHDVARWLIARDDPRWSIQNGKPVIREPLEALHDYLEATAKGARHEEA